MLSTLYIAREVTELVNRHHTRCPYELCERLDIYIHHKDLGHDIKAYYFCQSRIRNIVINSRVSETVKRILVAHELGHDRLHSHIATLKGFKELDLFDMATPTETEANLFAAELLIQDQELMELLNEEHMSFFEAAKILEVPPELLDFKFRALKQKGYSVQAPYIAAGDFLGGQLDGCYAEEETWLSKESEK